MVDAPGMLCPVCWGGLAFLAAPLCDACGRPFPFSVETGALCGACLRARPDWDRARAALVYDDRSRRLILGFKHADRTDAASAFGRWLARAGRDLTQTADMIVPVPLHPFRLWRRRYNQAALLALAVGRMCGKPVKVDLLRRLRATPPQGRLGRAERARNVEGAFALRKGAALGIQGKRVLLVDDVLTSGATAGACARLLKAHGAQAVDLLTLARVG